MGRINVSAHRKENPASIHTYAPPPRSDAATTTVAMAGRFNVIDRRKEASILTCAPPPPRSDAATATVAMGRINLHEHRKENSPELPTQPRELKKLHASVAPLLAELAEKEKELMEAIRNTEEPPARFVLKSKDPELWEIVDLPLGENAFFDDEKEGQYDVIC